MVDKRLILLPSAGTIGTIALVLVAYTSLSSNATAINSRDAPEQEIPEVIEDYEAQLQSVQAKELATTQLVLEDERVRALIDRSKSYQTDILTDKDGDTVIVQVTGERDFSGDYKSGYTMTYSGLAEGRAVVKDGQIISYDEVNKVDSVTQVSYTEEEQKLVEVVLSDASVKSELAKKQGGDIVVDLVTIYADQCSADGCRRANIYMEDVRKDGVRALINPETLEILHVSGWQT